MFTKENHQSDPLKSGSVRKVAELGLMVKAIIPRRFSRVVREVVVVLNKNMK
jgi:hypothetical protein